MPIYEYRCTECGHELEALQKLSDSPLTTCPQCSNETLVKRVSAAAFRLKGGGWYETDFKSKNQKNLAGDKARKTDDKPSKDSKIENSAKKSAEVKKSSSDGHN